jgi:hypothetical protein
MEQCDDITGRTFKKLFSAIFPGVIHRIMYIKSESKAFKSDHIR